MHIPYESFPASFEACWLSGCALQSRCLHHLYQDVKPKSITMRRAIMQEALLKENLVEKKGGKYLHLWKNYLIFVEK